VPLGRVEAIHATVEAGDGATARDVRDELEEARVVRREQKRRHRTTDLHAVLRADMPMRSRPEAALLDRRKQLVEERGLQKPSDHGAVALAEFGPKLGALGLRAGVELQQTLARPRDPDHWRPSVNREPRQLRYRG
jgi:hypothetical protein